MILVSIPVCGIMGKGQMPSLMVQIAQHAEQGVSRIKQHRFSSNKLGQLTSKSQSIFVSYTQFPDPACLESSGMLLCSDWLVNSLNTQSEQSINDR